MTKTKKLLKHLLIPHKSNAFRPHATRHKALSIYSIGLMLSQLLFGVTMYSGPIIMSDNAKAMTQNIITLSNQNREKYGLDKLSENEILSQAAEKKLTNMFEKNYWDHTGPSGETAWDFLSATNYTYYLAGENLARGFSSSTNAVNAWMESPTHRRNILNDRFKEIGVAVGSGKINGNHTTLVVQLFGEPKTTFAQSSFSSQVLGESKLIPEVSLSNITESSKTPYFTAWVILFLLIIFDGIMIRQLRLHASKSHLFNFRASLLLAGLGLILLSVGFVGIA